MEAGAGRVQGEGATLVVMMRTKVARSTTAAAQTLETRLYDAVTSLEPRLTKNISTRAIRRDPARPLAGGRA